MQREARTKKGREQHTQHTVCPTRFALRSLGPRQCLATPKRGSPPKSSALGRNKVATRWRKKAHPFLCFPCELFFLLSSSKHAPILSWRFSLTLRVRIIQASQTYAFFFCWSWAPQRISEATALEKCCVSSRPASDFAHFKRSSVVAARPFSAALYAALLPYGPLS